MVFPLLKTLEEPGKVTLILIAPSPESVLPTLVSRCQKIPFYRLDNAAMKQVLTQTGNTMNIFHGITGGEIRHINFVQSLFIRS